MIFAKAIAESSFKSDNLPVLKKKNVAPAKSTRIEMMLLRELPFQLIQDAMEQYRTDYELFGFDMANDLLDVFKAAVKKT